ncbi:hypothetical protein QM565_33955 [Geitlerinema splendidum]|nr:hypothetical protein [Geitlerinema splendidum]
MKSIKLRSHVGSDGILQLQVPVAHADQDLEVIVIYQAVEVESVKTPEALGWQPGFFERTAGSIPDLERPPQGVSQEREPLA